MFRRLNRPTRTRAHRLSFRSHPENRGSAEGLMNVVIVESAAKAKTINKDTR
jgi:hypothetical protein